MHHDDNSQNLSGIYGFRYFVGSIYKQYNIYLLVVIVGALAMKYGLKTSWLLSISIPLIACVFLIAIKSYYKNRAEFPNKKIFWQSQKLLQQARFVINRFRFRTQISTQEAKSRSVILSTLLRISFFRIFPSIVVSILFMIGCWYLNQTPITPTFVSSVVTDIPVDSSGAYDGVLLTILTIIGIFLTLYFTNMNTVMGTLYAELPEKPRQLFLRERVGDTSVGFLIFLTIYVLVLLVVGTVFNFRPIIGVVLGATLGALIVPLFAQLSNRAFIYFDPTHFSGDLLTDLDSWTSRATTEGYLWNDKSFQYHYFSQAQNILSAFHTLSDISYERPYLRKEGLIKNVIKTLTNYLPVYIKKKRRIPRKSRWYQEVLSHKDWYLSDYTSIALATQTSTQLRPTPKTDNEWFEREVFQLTEKALRRFVDDRNVEGVVAILELLRKAYRGLGSDWLVGFAKQSLIDLSSVVISIQTEDQKLTNNEELLRLQMLSDLLVLPIDTLLGCFATVGTIKIDEIRIHLEGFDWNKPEELYTFNIPANTLDGIEDLAPRIQFEIEAEGKIITPNWFALQAIIVSINLTLHEEVKHLEELGHNFFLNLASKLLEQDQPMMAMLTISNGLQFLDKFYVHMNTLKGFVNEMNLVRHFSSMRWVEWDWDSIYTEAKATEKKLGERVAQSISEMVKRNPNSTDEIPDFLGEALNIVGNQYFQALYENDLEHATSLFEPLFKGNLTKYNALLPRLFELKVDFSRFILSSSEPISDLLELSGYAYLFSKYHNNPALWEHCKEVWREYANGGDAQTQIKSILSIVSTARKEIGFGSRYQTRSVWRQHFMSKLRELDYTVYDDPHGSIVPRSICNHPDIVIRTLAPKERYSLDINNDIAMSVFAELYLYDIVDAKEGDYRFEEIKNRIVWQQEDEKATGFVPTTDE